MKVEAGEDSAEGPAVVVSLSSLCRSVPYTVELSFGVREEDSGEKCLPQQNVTANTGPEPLSSCLSMSLLSLWQMASNTVSQFPS